MRAVIFICICLGILALVAFVTRPDQAKAEAALKDQLITALGREELRAGRGTGGNLALGLCKLKPHDCYDLVRRGIDATFTDHSLYTRFQISGYGKTADCYGAFTTFLCPGGLRDDG